MTLLKTLIIVFNSKNDNRHNRIWESSNNRKESMSTDSKLVRFSIGTNSYYSNKYEQPFKQQINEGKKNRDKLAFIIIYLF